MSICAQGKKPAATKRNMVARIQELKEQYGLFLFHAPVPREVVRSCVCSAHQSPSEMQVSAIPFALVLRCCLLLIAGVFLGGQELLRGAVSWVGLCTHSCHPLDKNLVTWPLSSCRVCLIACSWVPSYSLFKTIKNECRLTSIPPTKSFSHNKSTGWMR